MRTRAGQVKDTRDKGGDKRERSGRELSHTEAGRGLVSHLKAWQQGLAQWHWGAQSPRKLCLLCWVPEMRGPWSPREEKLEHKPGMALSLFAACSYRL